MCFYEWNLNELDEDVEFDFTCLLGKYIQCLGILEILWWRVGLGWIGMWMFICGLCKLDRGRCRVCLVRGGCLETENSLISAYPLWPRSVNPGPWPGVAGCVATAPAPCPPRGVRGLGGVEGERSSGGRRSRRGSWRAAHPSTIKVSATRKMTARPCRVSLGRDLSLAVRLVTTPSPTTLTLTPTHPHTQRVHAWPPVHAPTPGRPPPPPGSVGLTTGHPASPAGPPPGHWSHAGRRHANRRPATWSSARAVSSITRRGFVSGVTPLCSWHQ